MSKPMKPSDLSALLVMLEELYPKFSLTEIKGIESFKNSDDKSVYITLTSDRGNWPFPKKYTLGTHEWFVGEVSVSRMLAQIRINREYVKVHGEHGENTL